MKIKIIKYTLACAATGLLFYLVRKKLLEQRRIRLQQRFIKDFSYQRSKHGKEHFGDFTL